MRLLVLSALLLVGCSAIAAPPQDSLSWTAPTVCEDGAPISSCPVTGYVVTVSDTAVGTFTTVATLDAKTVALIVPNTTAGTRCYKVVATSAGGDSAPSNTACKTQKISVPAGVGIVLSVK